MAVQHGDHVYDADGAAPATKYLKRWAKLENFSHHDLEFGDHNPTMPHKSGIVVHPDLVDKTYQHLKKHLPPLKHN